MNILNQVFGGMFITGLALGCFCATWLVFDWVLELCQNLPRYFARFRMYRKYKRGQWIMVEYMAEISKPHWAKVSKESFERSAYPKEDWDWETMRSL